MLRNGGTLWWRRQRQGKRRRTNYMIIFHFVTAIVGVKGVTALRMRVRCLSARFRMHMLGIEAK